MLKLKCFLLLSFLFYLNGCAHQQLRYQAVNQASSLNKLYEQQVLDNLAMFSVNHSSIPFFAFPNEGASNVEDSLSSSGAPPLNPFFTTLGFDAGRNSAHSWVLTPVRNPQSLALMQQAYQRALGLPTDECREWCSELSEFRGESPVRCPEKCAIHCGWICKSTRKRDVPKCRCKSFGKYCDTYVWVKPGCESEFSRLALLIIELAVNEPTDLKPASKKVTFFIDKDGRSTKQDGAFGTVEAVLPLEDDVHRALLPVSLADELQQQSNSSVEKLQKKHSFNGTAMNFMNDQRFNSLSAEDKADVEQAASEERARQEKINTLRQPSFDMGSPTSSLDSQSSEILRLQQRQRNLTPFFRE